VRVVDSCITTIAGKLLNSHFVQCWASSAGSGTDVVYGIECLESWGVEFVDIV